MIYPTAKTKDTLFSISDENQVQRLTSRFERFKEQFDRGIFVQSAVNIEEILEKISKLMSSYHLEEPNWIY
jgi:hypothetical protein